MRQPRANTSAIALFALLLSCCFAWPAVAGAESGGVLAPELAELASPTVRSQPLEAQAEALGFPTSGPGSLQREGAAVRVEIALSGGALAALPALEAAGATVEHSSGTYQLVSATVAPKDLTALAAMPGVTAVEAVREPMLSAPAQTSATILRSAKADRSSARGSTSSASLVWGRKAKRSAPAKNLDCAVQVRPSVCCPTPSAWRAER